MYKYVLNLNKEHKYLEDKDIVYAYGVFGTFDEVVYKNQEVLKAWCKNRVTFLENNHVIGKDDRVYIIFSGLTVVAIAFISELIKEGYNPVMLFEDKENKKYYKLEVNK